MLTVNSGKFAVVGQQRLLEGQLMSRLGIVKFGIGGFESSNQTHLFLVVSHEAVINYFRFVRVDDCYEWHHVYTTSTMSPILHGSFLSNNLMVLLT